jgi:hypothetical protein
MLHVLPVSRTHFFMKLVRAAPCKFLSVAREWQVSAMATPAQNDSARASENTFVILPPQGAIQVDAPKIYAPSKLSVNRTFERLVLRRTHLHFYLARRATTERRGHPQKATDRIVVIADAASSPGQQFARRF